MPSYKQAGVDVDRADRFVRFIKGISSPVLDGEIGAFSGGIEIDPGRWNRPLLMTTSDGVGTKLLVARELGRFDTVGIDLVAMCVNDLLVSGAEPVAFQDYIACGRLDEALLHPLIEGVVRGCELADCRLAGGETAELPGMYGPGEFDLAGFAAGLVEREGLLPHKERIGPGDVLIGLRSSGIHSNGLSLARKVLSRSDFKNLLTPTRIYVEEMRTLLATGAIRGAAHITGGGLLGNIPRMLPEGCGFELTYDWPTPPIFDAIQQAADIDDIEMRRTFNMGLGMVMVVGRQDLQTAIAAAHGDRFELLTVGRVT